MHATYSLTMPRCVGCGRTPGGNPLQGAAAAGLRRSRVRSRSGSFGVVEVAEVTEIIVVAAVPATFGLTLGRGWLLTPTGLGQLDARWLRRRNCRWLRLYWLFRRRRLLYSSGLLTRGIDSPSRASRADWPLASSAGPYHGHA